VAVAEAVIEPLCEGVPERDALLLGVPVGDAPADKLAVGEAVREGVPLGDPDLLGVPLLEGVPEVLPVGEPEGVPEGLAPEDSVPVFEGVGERVPVEVLLVVALGVRVRVTVGEAEGLDVCPTVCVSDRRKNRERKTLEPREAAGRGAPWAGIAGAKSSVRRGGRLVNF
jgi:hypothetical protein